MKGTSDGEVLGWHYEVGASPNALGSEALSQKEAMFAGGGVNVIDPLDEQDAEHGLLHKGQWVESIYVDSLTSFGVTSPAGSYELRLAIQDYGKRRFQPFRVEIHTDLQQEHFNAVFVKDATQSVVQNSLSDYVLDTPHT